MARKTQPPRHNPMMGATRQIRRGGRYSVSADGEVKLEQRTEPEERKNAQAAPTLPEVFEEKGV